MQLGGWGCGCGSVGELHALRAVRPGVKRWLCAGGARLALGWAPGLPICAAVQWPCVIKRRGGPTPVPARRCLAQVMDPVKASYGVENAL